MRQGVVRIQGKGPPLTVEITETMAERRRGLEGHAPLSPSAGMLFPFSPPRVAEFHMAGVQFPIDLLFSRNGQVVRVVTGTPGQKDTWQVPQIDAVLEVRGGWCKQHGVTTGDQLVMGPEHGRASRKVAAVLCRLCASKRVAYHEISGTIGCTRCGWLARSGAQSADVLRTLTEAAAEADNQDVAEEQAHMERLAVGAQVLVQVLPEQRFHGGKRVYDHMARLFDRRTSRPELEKNWGKYAQQLDFWERDAVVHALVCAGHEGAVSLLRVAQAIPRPPPVGGDVSPALTSGSPGAVRRTPPSQAWVDHQMPADIPGIGLPGAAPLFEQSIGYDPTRGEDLLDGRVPPIRPAASLRTAGGDVHPGDRVKITDEVDGLEKDAGGVCLEVQGDSVKIKLDGEPVPRWILNDLCQQDKAKDDILQEMQEGDGGGAGGGGGGMGDLLGLLGGG